MKTNKDHSFRFKCLELGMTVSANNNDGKIVLNDALFLTDYIEAYLKGDEEQLADVRSRLPKTEPKADLPAINKHDCRCGKTKDENGHCDGSHKIKEEN